MRRIGLFSLFLFLFLCAAAPYQEPVQSNSCAMAYGRIPDPMPEWLKTNVAEDDLATSNRYDILAGQLLKHGIVNGSTCPAFGLNADGSPNACGLQVTQEMVITWQNQYDHAIGSASQRYNMPSSVLKAVIAVESQFWPAPNWVKGEIGLGQMTEFGADLVLMWRPEFYQGICRQVFGDAGCSTAYMFQDIQTQRLLRGQVLKNIDVTCPSCAYGIDIEKGDLAVSLLAETLNASCSQSARTIAMATGHTPASLLSYEDFWRFSLANYHSGSGCMVQALRRSGNPTSWAAIADGFPSGCLSGSTYIRRIEEQIKP